MYNIYLLPALFGDSILIEYGTKELPRYILIDGGPYYGFKDVLKALNKVAPGLRELELLVVTHIDIDHIDGIITLMNQSVLPFTVKEIWFNGWPQLREIKTSKLGALQGEYLSQLIEARKLPHNSSFGGKAVMVENTAQLPVVSLEGGMTLTLLSPHLEALQKLKNSWKKEVSKLIQKKSIEERWKNETRYSLSKKSLLGKAQTDADQSIANASSIAFIARFDNKTCLFAGDATTAELLKSINPLLTRSGLNRLEIDAWKLAHHGSEKSTRPEIMQLIEAVNILVSTNGDRYKHPDKDCIAGILNHNPGKMNLFFNYLSPYNEYWNTETPKTTWKYEAIYGQDSAGVSVNL